MKKILLMMTMVGTLFGSGLFSNLASLGDKEVKPLPYRVDVYGNDVRVYEFRSVSNPDILCIALFGNNRGEVTMQCINTKTKEQ